MSHRRGDHMGGLSYVLRVNPGVKIYAPKEGFGVFGVFGVDLPSTFYRKDPSLPQEQRYYDGNPPEIIRGGSAWPSANFQLVDKETEIAPGIRSITLVSDKPGTLELRELSLVINTPEGTVIVVGCSHPGVDRIVAAAASINPRIHMIAGGFHLVVTSDADIEKVVTALHDTYKVEYVAPGHCTGEPAFTALRKAFGDRYLYAGRAHRSRCRLGRRSDLFQVGRQARYLGFASGSSVTGQPTQSITIQFYELAFFCDHF